MRGVLFILHPQSQEISNPVKIISNRYCSCGKPNINLRIIQEGQVSALSNGSYGVCYLSLEAALFLGGSGNSFISSNIINLHYFLNKILKKKSPRERDPNYKFISLSESKLHVALNYLDEISTQLVISKGQIKLVVKATSQALKNSWISQHRPYLWSLSILDR